MKSNNFFYLFKEGFKGVFQHGFMSFAAVMVTLACLLVIGSCSALLYNVNDIVDRESRNAKIVVYINDTYSQAEARSVGSQINMIENVQQSTFVTREQALADFVAGQEDVYAGVDPQTIQDRFVVTLEDNGLMRQTVPLLQAITGVSEVEAPFDLAENFGTLQHILQIVSLAIVALLLVVSLLIISNTVKLAMYDRKDEIAIMKMVGATNGFIRLPFIVEGFTLGMIGAVLAFGLEWVGYDALVQRVSGVDSLQLFSFVPFQELLIPMVVVFAGAGMFVGIVGSWTSIRKFMDV